jgi:myo-inositol 2-dehydrogenase/D-chiro-inositol 1-dehydrogenase
VESDGRLRIGCVGCGFIAGLHMQNIADHPMLIPWAYADTRRSAAEDFLGRFGGRYATESADEVFEDPDIDAVIICTPDGLHAEMAVKAARAGKHILVEKPLALTSADCVAVQAAVEEAGVVCGMNFKFRYSGAIRAARERVPHPYFVILQSLIDPVERSGWKGDRRLSGGPAYDLGSHLFDLAAYFCDAEPVTVSAVARWPDDLVGKPGNVMAALVTFANGAIATVTLGDATESQPASKWLCQLFDGSTSASVNDHYRNLTLRRAGDADVYTSTDDDEAHLPGAMRLVTDAFVRNICEGIAMPGIAEGSRAVRLIEACIESTRRGEPVAI